MSWNKNSRKRRTWTGEEAIAAIQAFAEKHGRPPVFNEARAANDLPPSTTTTRLFGSWTNALVAAGLEPTGSLPVTKDEETAVLMERVYAGETVVQLAEELGISPQSLGRRIDRYRVSRGMGKMNLPRGKRRKD